MRPEARALLAALLLAVLAVLGWRSTRRGPSDAASPAAALTAPSPAASSLATASPSPHATSERVGLAPGPDAAEASLRQLELIAATDKPRALRLALEDDATLSSRGVMAEARRALIVTLLVDTNRIYEARAHARKFTSEYPDSRYLPLVQGVTGVHPRPKPSQLRDARAAH